MNLRDKFQISITLLVVTVGALFNFTYCRYAEQVLFAEVGERLADIAKSVASQIDADAHNSLMTSKDEHSEAYKDIKLILRKAKLANPDVRYIYTMRPTRKAMVWEFVVDAEENPDLVSHIGDKYPVVDCPDLRAGLGGPAYDQQITHDIWGDWISGYAPIRDENGRSVAIVGVDMSVRDFKDRMSMLRSIGIALISISAALSMLLAAILVRAMILPIRRFIIRLNNAARGDLETLVDDRRKDEIGEVAKTFNKLLATLKLKDKMLREMNTDYLTGLYTHRYFQQVLTDKMGIAQEHGGCISLIMLDLDRFKLVNDSFGHMAGDELLRQLAVILSTNIDDTSLLARYGGEEFAILLPDSSREVAVEIAQKLRKVVGEHNFEITLRTDDGKIKKKSLGATISMGIACYPDHCTDKDSLIKAADTALYQAKRCGRDCIRVYDGSIDAGVADASLLQMLVNDRSNCTFEMLAVAVDARDHYTIEHSMNVQKYSVMIGKWLGLTEKEIEVLGKAAALHDIGKIGVPDQVLNKPSDLNEAEMSIVRTHCVVGEAIVRNSDDNQAVLPGIRSHHERFDGKGYPDGLAGKSIPLMARIIAVADTYDALTSDRPHRRAYRVDQALEILRSCAGSQLDPEIVDAFCQAINACRETFKKRAA